MSRKSSATLFKQTNLLKDCADAYAYAVEVVHNDGGMVEEMARSCAEVCRDNADECLKLKEDQVGDRIYRMCLEYASLCDEIIAYQSTANHK